MLKRSFDVISALLGLLIFALPMLAVAARELGDPMLFLVQMIPDDRLLQTIALQAPRTADASTSGSTAGYSSREWR